MHCKNDKSNPAFLFVISAAVFFLCVAIGMFSAFNTVGELKQNLSSYLTKLLNTKSSFKQIFLKATSADFKYTVFLILSAPGKYTSFIPILFIGFKGFASGYSVILVSEILGTKATAVIAIAVFLSCVFTIPLHTVMFLLCRNCSKKMNSHNLTSKDKLSEYVLFIISVIIMYSLLCLANCLQSAVCPLVLRIAGY